MREEISTAFTDGDGLHGDRVNPPVSPSASGSETGGSGGTYRPYGDKMLQSPAAGDSGPALTVGIHTLGCRLNQYESDGILNGFQRRRYRVVPLTDGPDIAIVNTCTVTEQADARNRNIIRAILRRNPSTRVFVTGCYAQTDAERLLAIDGVRGVIGNDRKKDIFSLVEACLEAPAVGPSTESDRAVFAHSGGAIARKPGARRPTLPDAFAFGDVFPVDHSRAYLKIQDGCDRSCSYCKVPQARGGGTSRPFEEVLLHARRMDEAGIPEIVITGVNIGWYRDGARRLPDLLLRLLDSLRHARLRLSSLEPSDVGDRLIELSQHPRFCNYLHIPLQSGSASILRAMRRSYTPATFQRRMEKLRAVNPQIFLGTDVMVGFPGEKDADFEATLSLLHATGVVGVHAFPFSPRSGTPAAALPGRPHGTVVRRRMERLAEYREKAIQSFYAGMNGRHVQGIIEREASDDQPALVLTGEYLRLEVEGVFGVRKGHVLDLTVEASSRRGIPQLSTAS